MSSTPKSNPSQSSESVDISVLILGSCIFCTLPFILMFIDGPTRAAWNVPPMAPNAPPPTNPAAVASPTCFQKSGLAYSSCSDLPPSTSWVVCVMVSCKDSATPSPICVLSMYFPPAINLCGLVAFFTFLRIFTISPFFKFLT